MRLLPALTVAAVVAGLFSPSWSSAQDGIGLDFNCPDLGISFSMDTLANGEVVGYGSPLSPPVLLDAVVSAVISADASTLTFREISFQLANSPVALEGFFNLGLGGSVPFYATVNELEIRIPEFDTPLSIDLEFTKERFPPTQVTVRGFIEFEGEISDFEVFSTPILPKSYTPNFSGRLIPSPGLSQIELSWRIFLDLVRNEEFTTKQGEILNRLFNGRQLQVSIGQIFLLSLNGVCEPASPTPIPDSDGDGITDAADNCIDVPNGTLIPDAGGNSQLDTDQDGYGNVCDCDFDQSLTCNIQDFNFFLTNFFTATDSGIGTDMNGDGRVGIADFNLFLPGFAAGEPGPSGLIDCVAEGDTTPIVPGALPCCSGLASIGCDTQVGDICQQCTGVSICANCGDGICGLGENPCNCPEDCGLCIAEGDPRPVVPDALPCCSGLVSIPCADPVGDICQPCPGSTICADCGDGICGLGENSCNCPDDCGACIAEGDSRPAIPNAPPCCPGLVSIPCDMPFGDICEFCIGAMICTDCGNGVCGLGENVCNCPGDCPI